MGPRSARGPRDRPPTAADEAASGLGAGAARPAFDRFVGRAAVLERAQAALAAAAGGAGQVIWISGEPGIGKTRLLREIARRAGELGFCVLASRCPEEEGAPPCWPWAQIVRRGVEGLEPSAVAARFGRAAAASLRLLPAHGAFEPGAGPAADDPGARFRLFDAVAELLRARAREAPLLVAIDDLHRADATTALLLRHALRELEIERVAFALAYRDEEVGPGHPLAGALDDVRPGAERIRLGGLGENELAELVQAHTGHLPRTALRRAIHERTLGNPFFCSEIARDLAERGSLERAFAAIEAATAAPAGLRHVIRRRVERLPERAADLLEVAAVVGRDFELAVVRDASHVCEAELRAVVDAALAAHLVEETGLPGRLRFAHVLVRDALYGDLAPMRRIELHRAVGLALEALHGGSSDDPVDPLALHFGEAAAQGEAERAWRYARSAGERALAQLAYDEAASRFEAALRALALMPLERGGAAGPVGREERLRERAALCVWLGRARWRAGAVEPARAAFCEAADLARAARASDLQAQAALGYAGRTDATPGVHRAAVTLLEEALAALPEADSPLRSEVLARLGTELYYDADRGRSDALTREAVAVAQRLGDDETLAYALSARGYVLMRPEVHPRERLALAERQIALASRARSRDVEAIGLQERIVSLLELGEVVRLDRALGEFAALAEALGQPFFRWMSAAFACTRAFLDGRVAEAERLAEAALRLGQGFGTPNALPAFSAQIFQIRREQGRLAELEPLLRSALDQEPFVAPFRAGLCVIHAEMGKVREAGDALAQLAGEGLDDVPRDQNWIGLLATLARACTGVRDASVARHVYERLRPFEGRLAVFGHGVACDGAVSHHLATLAATFGDLDTAEDHYEAALTELRRAGARLFGAHAQRELAEVLDKRSRPGDRARSRALRAEADAAYRALARSDEAGRG